nr:hypothetical protein [FCB group bacterium]
LCGTFSPQWILFYWYHPELSRWKRGEGSPEPAVESFPQQLEENNYLIRIVRVNLLSAAPNIADIPPEYYYNSADMPKGWRDSLIVLFGTEKHSKAFIVLGPRGQGGVYSAGEVEFISNITLRAFEAYERVELTNQLMAAEKKVTVNEVAAGIAHEIANNITPIIGRAQLLRSALTGVEDDNLRRRIEKHVDVIYGQACKIARISSNLTKLSRPMELEMKELVLEDEIKSAVEIMSETAGKIKHFKTNEPGSPFQLKTEFQPSLPRIRGDSQQLQQVFINLIINAAHTIEDKGLGAMTVGTRKGVKNTVVGFVEDTGMGMSENVLEQMWKPFFTTKKQGKGTGLGMAIVKNLIDAHGGRIEIQTELGKGTRFDLIFNAID